MEFLKKYHLFFIFLSLTAITTLSHNEFASINTAWASDFAKNAGTLSNKDPFVIAIGSGLLVGGITHFLFRHPYISLSYGGAIGVFSYLISNQYTTKTGKDHLESLYKTYFCKKAGCHKATDPADVKKTVKKYRAFFETPNTLYPHIQTEHYLRRLRQAIIDMYLLIERVSGNTHHYKDITQEYLCTLFDQTTEELEYLLESPYWKNEQIQKVEDDMRKAQLLNIQANTAQQKASAHAYHAYAHEKNAQAAQTLVETVEKIFG